MKHISTCQVMWTNKIIATGHLKIHNSTISVLSTEKDWLSAVGSLRLEFWPLLPWRQWRCNSYCDIRALCGNATQLLWTRVTSSWDRSLISMVSARRSNSPHSKGTNKCSAGNVSTTRHFPWQRCSMAGKFTCSLRLWLLFMGVSQKQSFHV